MRAVFTSIVVAIVAFAAHPASAEVYSCHIGKPSYCFKYGGNFCEQWNNAPDKPAACEPVSTSLENTLVSGRKLNSLREQNS